MLYYKEAKDGQILEEGITEAGSMCSFIAAGTAYAKHGINTIPFFIYYSMFGFQRIGDLDLGRGRLSALAASCSAAPPAAPRWPAKACSTRTAHSHVLALSVPNLLAYDPAFAYEIAVIIQDGIKRMYVDQESIFYYLTVTQRAVADAGDAGRQGRRARAFSRACIASSASEKKDAKLRAQLFGSGAIMSEVLKAQQILEEKYGVAADVWSVTSYKRALSRRQRLRALEHAASRRNGRMCPL